MTSEIQACFSTFVVSWSKQAYPRSAKPKWSDLYTYRFDDGVPSKIRETNGQKTEKRT